MAYALLALQFPVVGLYNSLFYPMIYAFFGSSKHVAIGEWRKNIFFDLKI